MGAQQEPSVAAGQCSKRYPPKSSWNQVVAVFSWVKNEAAVRKKEKVRKMRSNGLTLANAPFDLTYTHSLFDCEPPTSIDFDITQKLRSCLVHFV